MHPDILMELARQKQAELIAAGEASRAAARVGGDERVRRRWVTRPMQARILRPWSRRRPLLLAAAAAVSASRSVQPSDPRNEAFHDHCTP